MWLGRRSNFSVSVVRKLEIDPADTGLHSEFTWPIQEDFITSWSHGINLTY